MSGILDIAGKPLRPRKHKRRFKKQDIRDLGKIAGVLAFIAMGYFQFAPEDAGGGAQAAAMARQ